jgi:NADH dehydrogenase
MSREERRVIVIGAGYAGLLATVRLAGKTRGLPVTITLVNESDLFVERVRLHQFAANQPVKRRPIVDALRKTGVHFIRGRVTALRPVEREIVVQTDSGPERLPYDNLLYALGSTIDCDSVPGVRDHAYRLTPAGPMSAETLRVALPDIARKQGRLIVVGGGPTGIEAAAEFKGAYPPLEVSLIVRGEFGAFTTPKVAGYMRQSLGRQKVAVIDNRTVASVERDVVVTDDGAAFPFDVCLWTGGFSVPPLAREAGMAVNERDQVLVDPFLKSVSHPEIFAVGDAAHPVENPGAPVRMAAVTAVVMGAHAADCLAAELKGRPPKPLGFWWLGQGISLGRRDAVGFNNFPDDVQRGPIFTGRLGMWIRESFVHFLAALPVLERLWPGFFLWLGPRRSAADHSPMPDSAVHAAFHPQARDAPGRHRHVQNNPRPQGDADESRADACINEESDNGGVVEQHGRN